MAAIEGNLSRVGLTDILQMECLSGRSGLIVVQSLKGLGTIRYEPNRVLHVSYQDATDHEAMVRLLGLQSGWFRVQAPETDEEATIKQNWQSFLMDCVVTADERAEENSDAAETASDDGMRSLVADFRGATAMRARETAQSEPRIWSDSDEFTEPPAWSKLNELSQVFAAFIGDSDAVLAALETQHETHAVVSDGGRRIEGAFQSGASAIDDAVSLESAMQRYL